jgi:hypothetical protein
MRWSSLTLWRWSWGTARWSVSAVSSAEGRSGRCSRSTWLFGNHQGTITHATADGATGTTNVNYHYPYGAHLSPDTIALNRGFPSQTEDTNAGLVYL